MKQKLSILIAAILATLIGCQAKLSDDSVNKIIGTWRTDDPRYEGLYVQIEKDKISFATAGGGLDSYPISDLSKLGTGKLTYNILFANRDGQQYKFEFFYEDSRGGGVIVFKSRPKMKWTRDKS